MILTLNHICPNKNIKESKRKKKKKKNMSTRRVQSLPCKAVNPKKKENKKRKKEKATSKGKKKIKDKKEEDQCGQAHVQLHRGIFVQK